MAFRTPFTATSSRTLVCPPGGRHGVWPTTSEPQARSRGSCCAQTRRGSLSRVQHEDAEHREVHLRRCDPRRRALGHAVFAEQTDVQIVRPSLGPNKNAYCTVCPPSTTRAWPTVKAPPFLYSFSFLRAQQRFDRAALVHRAIALGDLPERQRQVEHFARVNLAVEDQGDQIRKIAANGCGATEKTDVPEEEIRAVERDAVRDADVADRSAGSRGPDRLLHRLLSANALEDRISPDAVRQLFDPLDALVAALANDVRGAELACELLPRVVAAHRDDAFGTHLPGREHAEESDRAVTHDDDRRAWLDVRGIGRKPAGPHHVGQCQHARDHVGIWDVARRDERAVRQRHAQARRLCATDRCPVLAGSLKAMLAMRARVVGGEERSDHELSGLQGRHAASDLFDVAAVLVPHRRTRWKRGDAAIGPEIRTADARHRQTDDRVRRVNDRWLPAVLEPDVARAV